MKIKENIKNLIQKIKNNHDETKNQKFLLDTTYPIINAICIHSTIFEIALSQIRHYFKEFTTQTKELCEITNNGKRKKIKHYRFKNGTQAIVEYFYSNNTTKKIIIKITKIKKYRIGIISKLYTDKIFLFEGKLL